MLFEKKERTFQGPKSYVENDWEYLDRSARIEAQKVRDFLEHWLGEYPNEYRDELIARLKAPKQKSFSSATFELVLFALLRSIGCSITVHPDLKNESGTHPDFLTTSDKGERAYVEAALASEFSEADVAARRRTSVVLNAIEKVDSPNFFLGVSANGHPDRPPSGKRMRAELEYWLSSLDADTIAKRLQERGPSALPTIECEEDGWRIRFEAIPKIPEKRGKGQRVIGILSGGARFVNSWEPIRDAIKAKGNRYGELDHPLIVAVNVDAFHVDRIDEMQGLFGAEEYVFQRDDPSPPQMRRQPNGAWFGPGGPQYSRVSGAWLFCDLNTWNIVTRANTVYFNPWGAKPLPECFREVNHAKVEGEQMRWIAGKSLSELLGLSTEWPR